MHARRDHFAATRLNVYGLKPSTFPRLRAIDKVFLKTLSFSRAKREAQLTAMIGMVGELQGIMGQAMPEIAAIDGPQ